MTTIEIYERVPYNGGYHRWVCKWDNKAWFFTDDKQYNTTFSNLADAEKAANAYSHLVDTFVTPILPKNDKDLLLLVHTHMPELLI